MRDILAGPNDEAIARTIVALGNGPGLTVIAEGVETAEQKDCQTALGCFFTRAITSAGLYRQKTALPLYASRYRPDPGPIDWLFLRAFRACL